MIARITLAVLMLAGLAGCSQSKNADETKAKPDQAIVDEVKARYGGDIETIAVAKIAGCDYLDLVARCFARDKAAMHELFELTMKAGFDGAASEGNSAVLGDVLRDQGDRFFGACLQMEPVETRKAIWNELMFDFGAGNAVATEEDIASDYPKTFAGFKPTPATASSGPEDGR